MLNNKDEQKKGFSFMERIDADYKAEDGTIYPQIKLYELDMKALEPYVKVKSDGYNIVLCTHEGSVYEVEQAMVQQRMNFSL